MAWFKENLFKKWFTNFHKASDSYKNAEGKGLLERYVETIGNEIDENILPYLENLQDNILMPKSIIGKLLPYREQELGVNLVYDETLLKRRQILSYWLRLVQIKGTKRGYEVCIRLMNFDGLVIYTVDVFVYFDNPLPSAGCNSCYEYDVVVTGSREILNLTIVDAFFNLIEWNEPINCKLRFFIYNDTYVPNKLVYFFFKGRDDENLYVDIRRNPTFKVFFDKNTNNQGHLLLEGEYQNFYEYDSLLHDNQGKMMYREPTQTAYLPFVSLVPTNVTQTEALLHWEFQGDAVYYLLNVGRDLRENGNEVILEKIIDNLNIGIVTNYQLVGLLPNTPYYAQIKAVRADNKIALSHPQPFVTMRDVVAPIALQANNVQSLSFRANWHTIQNVNSYEVQVSTDFNFTNILVTQTVIGNFGNTIINLPIGNNYYYRVRAIINRFRNILVVPSYSNWSNIISIPPDTASYALLFNGINNFIAPTNNSPFDINTGAISVFVKTTDNTNDYQAICVKQFAYGLFKFGNELVTYDWGRSRMRQTGFYFTNQYHHIVMNFTDIHQGQLNNTQIFVDGQLIYTTSISLFSNMKGFRIGTGSTDFSEPQIWKGAMRKISIYNRNLTNSEVSSIFANNNVNSDLIARYLLNEGFGNIARDTSANGNDAVLQNFLYTDFGNTNQWIDENDNPIE